MRAGAATIRVTRSSSRNGRPAIRARRRSLCNATHRPRALRRQLPERAKISTNWCQDTSCERSLRWTDFGRELIRTWLFTIERRLLLDGVVPSGAAARVGDREGDAATEFTRWMISSRMKRRDGCDRNRGSRRRSERCSCCGETEGCRTRRSQGGQHAEVPRGLHYHNAMHAIKSFSMTRCANPTIRTCCPICFTIGCQLSSIRKSSALERCCRLSLGLAILRRCRGMRRHRASMWRASRRAAAYRVGRVAAGPSLQRFASRGDRRSRERRGGCWRP